MPTVAAVFEEIGSGPRVVGRREQLRLPGGGDGRGGAQHLHGGERHRHRTGGAVLALVPEVVERGAGDEPAGAGGPGERMQAVPERELHQLVIGRVVLHLVDSMAGVVVGAQLGRGSVRLVREELHPLAADEVAEARGLLVDPAAALACDRRAEDRVADPGVVADERRRLVRDLVGGAGEADGVEVVEAVVHGAPEVRRIPDGYPTRAGSLSLKRRHGRGGVEIVTARHPSGYLTMFDKAGAPHRPGCPSPGRPPTAGRRTSRSCRRSSSSSRRGSCSRARPRACRRCPSRRKGCRRASSARRGSCTRA